MLAKPAINVMPVMARRASVPKMRTSAAKAASYRPQAMATPISSHATVRPSRPCDNANVTSARANSPLDASSTGRPPRRSISRPAQGLISAARIKDIDSSANTLELARPSSFDIGAASRAGR